jgi:hypothetical protein
MIWQAVDCLIDLFGKQLVSGYCTIGSLTLPPSLKEEVLALPDPSVSSSVVFAPGRQEQPASKNTARHSK